ncbi:MAG: DNA methyltransferase [Bacteroidetes bacterium GWA2_31_9]|nr:MAG: DNA methyltransferase [Bacteroidetes bacterium GWA2_31_9]
MTIQQYLEQLNKRFKSGISREHAYRSDLESLIRGLVNGVEITNEPSNVTDCGNPDFVITKSKIPIGYIEAKDIGKDLNSKQFKEQFTRYKKALDNLIITDNICFQFFQHGELVREIMIAEIDNNSIKPIPENFTEFTNLIQNFCTFIGQTIKSSKKLAEMMAAKARLLQNILERAITSDEETQENTSLKQQFDTFKSILIHDLTPKDFADIYAQTLAYGMFAARLHDTTLDNFSRQEAAELIPKTNPFLRKLFQYVAGFDIDERIKTTVDNLADVFRATNVDALLHNFGKSTQANDPIIHFYETFLAEYDPKLRKSRGVWYTPEPVVKFIVRAVDDILKSEFGLSQGLADTSKTKIKIKDYTKATADMRSKTREIEREIEVHKVQILDPATGTGTFLAEVVKHIYNNKFKAMQGAWSGYVEEHLIPRLNGFEILMASYSMAHLKLDMLLTETGYKATKDQRFNIYLTNSLEEHHPDTGTLFAGWLSSEANEANHIKRDTPVMCVIGNPPYSVSSSNKSEWIEKLTADYKKDLNERNIQPLSDDYIKFIRFGQHFIDKNGSGVLAYISNNSFIDGIIHRQMRKHLLESFDKIYIIDLHGNAKKKEICPDGSPDQNVFDIMQGVSINIFVKNDTKKKNDLGKIFHFDLQGKREFKYDFLIDNSLKTIKWNNLEFTKPNYYFVKKNFDEIISYEKGFKIDELFSIFGPGVETGLDNFFVAETKKELIDRFKILSDKTDEQFKLLKIENKKSFLIKDKIKKENFTNLGDYIYTYQYKIFDFKKIAYLKNSLRRADFNVFKNFSVDNYFLTLMRSTVDTDSFKSILLSKHIIDKNLYSFQTYSFPLYLYPENDNEDFYGKKDRMPNLNMAIVEQIAEKLGLQFTPEKDLTGFENLLGLSVKFAPIDILDYIYAVLHSPTYREKYKEFLKIDFPRVPYPKDVATFWQLVKLGGEIRQIHLLESPKVEEYITQYPEDGDNVVIKPNFVKVQNFDKVIVGNVFINETQYFANVPELAWSFYIGGYQPAQKWLKDRKNRKLSFEDILHYQKIIVALTETDRIMREIDKINIE